jgi:hypothetical protein
MEIITFDKDDLQTTLDVHSRGGKVLCPRCGEELIIVSNRSEAKKTGVSPGILCPVDRKHVERSFILREDFLSFDKWFQEMQVKKDQDRGNNTSE